MNNLDHLLDDALLGFDEDDEPSSHSSAGRHAPDRSSAQAAAASTAPSAASSSIPQPQQPSNSQASSSQPSSSAVPAGDSHGGKPSLQFDPLKRKRKSSSKPAAGAAGNGMGPSSSSTAARPALTPQVQQLQDDLAKLVNEWSHAMHPEAEADAAAAAAAGQQRSTSSVLQALAEQTQRTVQQQALMRPPPAGAAAAAAAAAGGSGGGGEQMTAIVDVVMQHLLSKDVLYQPMKEIMEQYPPWLDKQTAVGSSSTLTPEDLERYKAQYDCIRQLVAAYETEPDNTAKIMGLLQDMQACGEPPADIVEQMSSAISAELPADAGGGAELLGPEALGLDDVDLEQLPQELKNCPVQ